jgi:radical SAM protein with 4Fe4S-binding SPASM domain
VAREEGVRFVWYSPVPYCLVNPVLLGQGAKSCSCVSGILSVDPAGNMLPCSSFAEGIGSLVEDSFEHVWTSRAARYWKQRQYVPPPCEGCADVDVCAGACPLYWDAAGSFAELPRAHAGDEKARQAWEKRRGRGKSFGVQAPAAGGI